MRPIIFIFINKHWDALLASCTGCIFICLFTRHSGIGISPDSVAYLSTANNIRNHFSFTDFNGLPLVDFPLGYPFFLAMASFLTGYAVTALAPVLNGLLFSATILITGNLLKQYQPQSPFITRCILALLACSPFLLEVYSMLWSETLFIFLVILFIVRMHNYLQRPVYTNLLYAAFIAALAFITRYAGIALLGTGLVMIFFTGELMMAKKIKHLLLFAITGCSLALINLTRNHYLSGSLTGIREKSLRSLSVNLSQAGTILSNWLPFLSGHATASTILFIIIFLMAVAVLFYRVLQQQYFAYYNTIVVCFFVIYTVFIIASATISRFENLTSRLLIPLYIPFLLMAGSFAWTFLKINTGRRKKILVCMLLVFYAAVQYHYYRLNADAWEGIRDAGIPGYSEDFWTHSRIIAFLKKNKAAYTQPVYSNANDAVYFLTGISSQQLPHKDIPQEKAAFIQQPAFYLIWLQDGDNEDLVDLAFVRQYKKQVSVQEIEGGAVYFFTDSVTRSTIK